MSKELVDQASFELSERLQVFKRQPMTAATLYRIKQVIKDHFDDCKKKGIPFPFCVPVVLPAPFNWLHVTRAECTHEEIQALARQIIDAFPTITGPVLAEAIHRAFPDYKPDLQIKPGLIIPMHLRSRLIQ
jgi:hypothetical protein